MRWIKRESTMWMLAELVAFMIAGASAAAGGAGACLVAVAAGGFFRAESCRHRDIERAKNGEWGARPRPARRGESEESYTWR